MTSNHQPVDIGMIASLKVGHKSKMLRMLLDVLDIEGGYEAAAKPESRSKEAAVVWSVVEKPQFLMQC